MAASRELIAGTYRFRVINPSDAIALFPSQSITLLAQLYSGWTFNSPWSENYLVFRSSAVTNPNEFQLFDGALDPAVTLYASAALAYSGTVAKGYADKIRLAPPGRAGVSPSDYQTEYTLSAETTLLFVIPDNGLSDNNGGVSVMVTLAARAISITDVQYNPLTKLISMTWTSAAGTNYAVAYSLNMNSWNDKIIASLPGAAGTTTHIFPLPPAAAAGERIYFRVESN